MKTIEKNSINSFAKFSLKNLKEIFGSGVEYNCIGGTSILKCSPFKGTCLIVKIGDDTYFCKFEDSLKIANSGKNIESVYIQNIENINI